MSGVFDETWKAVFSWLGSLLNMPLPYFFGGEQLDFLDIVIGTLGLLVSVASIRALVGHGFSIAGSRLTADPADVMLERKNNAQYKNIRSQLKNGPVDIKDLDMSEGKIKR